MSTLAPTFLATANVNAKNKDGGTPLHYAAVAGETAMAELLIARGANVNAEDDFGVTPLMIATLKDYPEIVKVLKQHGAKE